MMNDAEALGCAFLVTLAIVISGTFGYLLCNKHWNDWNIQRAVESGEAHYDTKTGKLVWDKKQ